MKNLFATILKKIFTADYPYCIYCGREYGVDEKECCCPECFKKLKPDGKDEVFGFKYQACYAFEGPVRNVVHRYKYNGEKYLGEKIAQIMFHKLNFKNLNLQGIAHVPLHKSKRKKRGFDQSERIAKKLSVLIGIPYIDALKRTKDTVSQTHLTREERQQNVKDVFEGKKNVKGLSILLVDDVLTTGSTASECARILCRSGAKSVHIIVFAKAV